MGLPARAHFEHLGQSSCSSGRAAPSQVRNTGSWWRSQPVTRSTPLASVRLRSGGLRVAGRERDTRISRYSSGKTSLPLKNTFLRSTLQQLSPPDCGIL